MIYISRSDIPDSLFIDLLQATKVHLLNTLKSIDNSSKLEGVVFEDLVYGSARIAAEGTPFENSVERTGVLAFPDIIARKYYGMEVKVTTSDKWVSTGNSILESTRVPGVERIYMFFGKLGGEADIMYRPYQDCLSEVGVTHSPRYKIDMNLTVGRSIFDKMGVEYDVLRADKNPIRIVKDYYRSLLEDGEELWWIDQQDETPASPIIKPFQSLSREEQEEFVAECMVLFPEIFGSNPKKYERVAAYLVTSRNAVSANIRDYFSASGQVGMSIDNQNITVSRIFEKLYRLAPKIRLYFERVPIEKLTSYWRELNVDGDPLIAWKTKISELANPNLPGSITATDIFNQGLNYEEAP